VFVDLIDDSQDELEANLAVPFVPTDEDVIEAMLQLAGVNSGDVLYDLGSGDGRVVVKAALEYNVTAVGVEMDPRRIEEAREYAGWTGADKMVTFIEDDIFCAEFSEATVVTMYLLQSVNLRLRPRLLSELQPGTRIVSHDFDMGAWEADRQIRAGGARVFLWIVPADVEGVWEWVDRDGRHFEVELQQEFQQLQGKAWMNGQPAELLKAELRGPRVKLTIRTPERPDGETFSARYKDGQLYSKPIVWTKIHDGRRSGA
jgi:hypothetical protein